MVSDDAPSIWAASMSSRGMMRKCVRIQKMPNGMNRPASARMTPHAELVIPIARRSK